MTLETLSRPLLRCHRFVRQTGMGHFALLVGAFEPSSTQVRLPRRLEQLPVEYEMAALEGLESGLEGFPCQIQILDGLHHLVDSRPADFKRAGLMLAKEILAEPRGPAPPTTRCADAVRQAWEKRWRGFQAVVKAELELRLSSSGFQLTQSGFERRSFGLRQLLTLKGDSPILPSSVDLRLELKFENSERELGHLSLRRHLASAQSSGQRTLWRLEDETSEQDLLALLDDSWPESASAPDWLLANRPAGIYWWSAPVEARLLALNGQVTEARERARSAARDLQGKLGRGRELGELDALLEELG